MRSILTTRSARYAQRPPRSYAARVRNVVVALRPLALRAYRSRAAHHGPVGSSRCWSLIAEAVLAIDEAARRTSQPVRRLRQWCATGRIRCEHDGQGWLIPEAEIGRARAIGAARVVRGSDRSARALVVPGSILGSANLREQVAGGLRIPTADVSMDALTIDGQAYVIAMWPRAADARGSNLAELAEHLDGELLD